VKLKRCGGCGTVRYCSAECQRTHWRKQGHYKVCMALQTAAAAAAAAPEQGSTGPAAAAPAAEGPAATAAAATAAPSAAP
jgi:hypothetical protein